MVALEKIVAISVQLNSILVRVKKLDTIENSVKNIETNLANLKARTTKLEQFEITATKDIKELQDSCTFNGDKCRELQDHLKERTTTRINSLLVSERNLQDRINELSSKDLYLEAYSRREDIKFFSIPEEQDEDIEEFLRNYMEQNLGYRNARSVEIQRVHRLPKRRNDSGRKPIIAKFLRYKDVKDILALGRRLEGTKYQMFRDLPQEIIKRRKEQMPAFKNARKKGVKVHLVEVSQIYELYINGKLWPHGKPLESTIQADE